MLAYKAFDPGLICRDYQFVNGLNITDEANCARNGFHSAENPLDCLTYYSNLHRSEYHLVKVGGDRDEDAYDTKIACTELTILKRLTPQQLLLHGLAYMVDHPRLEWSRHVKADECEASWGYAIVRGKDPVARGKIGDILALAKECPDTYNIERVALALVDGEKVMPDVWYDVDLNERTVDGDEKE